MRFHTRLVFTLIVAGSLLTLKMTLADTPPLNLRDARYCEILLGTGGLIIPKEIDVYNTIGLNDCPQNLWSKMDPGQIKNETGAKIVKLNGPRHWLIDSFSGSSLIDPTVKNFGGIQMREAGILEVTQDLLHGNQPYHTHTVNRKTTSVFKAGEVEFQLVDPQGVVYFMQSYSLEKIDQSLSTLPQLGSKLSPPQGWSFRVITLTKDFFLHADNDLATVTQDEFLNTYQKSSAQAGDLF